MPLRTLNAGTLFIIFWTLIGSAWAEPAKRPYVPCEIILTLSPEVSNGRAWLSSKGMSLRSISPASGKDSEKKVYRLTWTGKETILQAIARLQRYPEVLTAQPNYIYHLCETLPNDPLFQSQWHLNNTSSGIDIHAATAWDVTTGTDEILVAVIDTGIDYNHTDLTAHVWNNPGEPFPQDGVDNDGNGYIDDWHGWDFVDQNNDATDTHSHGTHVSGIIGAVGNNGIGVSGVCWNVSILPLDTFDGDQSTSADLIEAIDYATTMGARIINASWGDQYEDLLMQDAIRRFTAAGGLFVTAAGNESGENNDYFTSFPPNFDVDALISVGASNLYDQVAGFSSIGSNRVHLMAPGDNIYSTYPSKNLDPKYGIKDGTSMASPIVAGMAALLWSWNSELTNLEVKYRILGAVDRTDNFRNKCLSGGRANAAAMFGQDATAPVRVSDLSLVEREYDRLLMNFTAPGDDGTISAARFYEIRYASFPIDEDNWELASRAYDVPQPAVAGTEIEYSLTGLQEGALWYIRMKAIDESGNISPLSNQLIAQTKPVRTLFSDDVESGTNGWQVVAGSSWARSDLKAHSGRYAWTDSPEGEYQQGDQYLISPVINLESISQPVLRFWQRYDIEPPGSGSDNDYGEIRASTDGVHWSSPLARYQDSSDWWRLETIDLTSFKGYSEVRIRFHFHANAFNYLYDYDGWYLDDIRVMDLNAESNFSGWGIF